MVKKFYIQMELTGRQVNPGSLNPTKRKKHNKRQKPDKTDLAKLAMSSDPGDGSITQMAAWTRYLWAI